MKVTNCILMVAVWMGVWCVTSLPGPAHCAGVPQKGAPLPPFEYKAPASEKARAYLGVTKQTFRISDISYGLLLLEVIGVYCPQCYQQEPLFNNLYNRIEKSSQKGRIKMVALAAGGTDMEIEFLEKENQYHFPVLSDPSFAAHKVLGEPRTPFTMLIDSNGKILYTHLGVIEDMDAFWKMMTERMR